jgi:hypothetical protein
MDSLYLPAKVRRLHNVPFRARAAQSGTDFGAGVTLVEAHKAVGSYALWLLALSAAAFGCADEEASDASSDKLVASDAGPGSGPACAQLDADSCSSNPACQPIEAARYDESRSCRAPASSVVGCMSTQACTGAITYAKDEAGRTWQLTHGCVPAGWTTSGPPTTSETAVSSWPVCSGSSATPSCSDLDADACSANAACHTIEALKYDESRTCRSSQASAVGCMAVTQGCTASIAYAKDASGGTWQLTSGCIPTGWTTQDQPASPPTTVSSWPVCDSPPAGQSECAAGTATLSPGCGASKPRWEKGCYASCSAVGNDTACAPGHTCQETWIDPCVPKPGENASCDSCGELTYLCLAAPAGT